MSAAASELLNRLKELIRRLEDDIDATNSFQGHVMEDYDALRQQCAEHGGFTDEEVQLARGRIAEVEKWFGEQGGNP